MPKSAPRRSIMRQVTSRLFRRRSTRNVGDFDDISEKPLSPAAPNPEPRVPFHRQLSRHISRMFSHPDDQPRSETKPRYNVEPFHRFMGETFPGSVKLEEHQVLSWEKLLILNFNFNMTWPNFWNLGCCSIPASPGCCILVSCVSTAGGKQSKGWHWGLLCQPNYTRAGTFICSKNTHHQCCSLF